MILASLIEKEATERAKVLKRNKRLQKAVKERFIELLSTCKEELKLVREEIESEKKKFRERKRRIEKMYRKWKDEVGERYERGEIDLDQYGEELGELEREMNDELLEAEKETRLPSLFEREVELMDIINAIKFVVNSIENCDLEIAKAIIYTINNHKELLNVL